VGERPDGRQDAGPANIESYARLGQLLCRRGRRIRCSHRPAVRRGIDQSHPHSAIPSASRSGSRDADCACVRARRQHLRPGSRAVDESIWSRDRRYWPGLLGDSTLALSRTHKADREYSSLGMRVVANQLPPLAYVVAGGLLVAGRPNGIYWIVPGVLLSFTAGIFGAWVLLIEIQR
jgi:hypothetical protein